MFVKTLTELNIKMYFKLIVNTDVVNFRTVFNVIIFDVFSITQPLLNLLFLMNMNFPMLTVTRFVQYIEVTTG